MKLVELLTLPTLVAQLIEVLGKLAKRRQLADLLSGTTARQLAEDNRERTPTITRIGAGVKRRLGYIEATSYFVYLQWVTRSSCLERLPQKVC